MTTVPVRLRIGCHVTTLGELDADEADPVGTYRRLAGLLDTAAADLRERVIPGVMADGGRDRTPE